jgi:hypothetical protein
VANAAAAAAAALLGAWSASADLGHRVEDEVEYGGVPVLVVNVGLHVHALGLGDADRLERLSLRLPDQPDPLGLGLGGLDRLRAEKHSSKIRDPIRRLHFQGSCPSKGVWGMAHLLPSETLPIL